jgi:mannose-6-phosphate isomerase-like protein (cupin superfamily)
MAFAPRRVVTGHDQEGRPVILIDEEMSNIVSRRAGQLESQIWSTDADLAKGVDSRESELRKVDSHIASGTVFRVVNYTPGVTSFPHANEWIDYTIIISGEIDMQLDETTEVHLKAGDVVVQRGTIHNWVNRGTKDCTLAFVRVGAKPEE